MRWGPCKPPSKVVEKLRSAPWSPLTECYGGACTRHSVLATGVSTGVFTDFSTFLFLGCTAMGSDDWAVIRVRREVYEKIRELAERRGVSISDVIAESLLSYLENTTFMDSDKCGGVCMDYLFNALVMVIREPWKFKDFFLLPLEIKHERGTIRKNTGVLPRNAIAGVMKLSAKSLKELLLAVNNILEKEAENCAVAIIRNLSAAKNQNVPVSNRLRKCLSPISSWIYEKTDVVNGVLRLELRIPLSDDIEKDEKYIFLKQYGMLKKHKKWW